MSHIPVQILDGSGLFVSVDAQQTTAGDRQQTLTIGDGSNPGRVVNVQPDGALEVASNIATVSALANVASGTASVQLAAVNLNRRGLILVNDSTAVLYVAYGAAASSTSFTVKVAAGGLHFMDVPVFAGQVNGAWATANGFCRVTDLSA